MPVQGYMPVHIIIVTIVYINAPHIYLNTYFTSIYALKDNSPCDAMVVKWNKQLEYETLNANFRFTVEEVNFILKTHFIQIFLQRASFIMHKCFWAQLNIFQNHLPSQ